MTIADQLLLLARTKRRIKNTLESRGVDMSGAIFADYADKIRSTTPQDERFVRPDLSTIRAQGGSATLPLFSPLPADGYSFDEAHTVDAVALAGFGQQLVTIYSKDLLSVVARVALTHTSPHLSFSRDDAYLAAGRDIIDASTWEVVETLPYNGVARFSPAADTLVLVSGATLRVLDVTDWSVLFTVTLPMSVGGGSGADCTAAFSADGSMFAVVGASAPKVRVYETTTWAGVDTISTVGSDWGDSVAFSPDGGTLAVGFRPNVSPNSNNKVFFYNTTTWAHQNAGWTGNLAPQSISYLPDGKAVVATTATSGTPNAIYRYTGMPANPTNRDTIQGWMLAPSVKCSRDGLSAYAYGRRYTTTVGQGPQGGLIRFELNASGPVILAAAPVATGLTPHPSVLVNPPILYNSGSTYSYAGVHGLFDARTGALIPMSSLSGKGLIPYEGTTTSIWRATSADGRFVASVGASSPPAQPARTASVWVMDTVADDLQEHVWADIPTAVVVSPDGSKVVVVVNTTATVMDRLTWTELFTITDMDSNTRVAVGNDGTIAYRDGAVCVASPPSGSVVTAPTKAAVPYAFSPDGTRLFCIGESKVRVLDVVGNVWETTETHTLINPSELVLNTDTLLVAGGAPVEVDASDLTRWQYLGATASGYAALLPE